MLSISCLLQRALMAVKVIVIKGNPPMSAFYDIAPALMRARKGGALTMQQLLQISYNMRTARTMSAFLEKDLTEIPALTAIREVISVNRDLENEITRCILSEDEMADNASPELRSIRRSIVRQNEAIKAKTNHMLSSAENKTLLQDSGQAGAPLQISGHSSRPVLDRRNPVYRAAGYSQYEQRAQAAVP